MRKIFILKTILDVIFIMSFFTVFSLLFMPFLEEHVKINGYDVETKTIAGKIVLFFSSVAYLAFFYVLYLFRQIAYWLLRRKIFDKKITNNLNKIGFLLILITILIEIPMLYYNITTRKNVEYGIRIYSTFFSIAIGLFFMIVSKIVEISISLKEENELTI